MKVLVLVDLSLEEAKELDEDFWIRKNGIVLEMPAKNRKCAVSECHNTVGISDVYCSLHTQYETSPSK